MRRSLSLVLLALALLATPGAAQDEPEPSPSSAAPSPSTDVAETVGAGPDDLGGTWRRTRGGPFAATSMPGGWTGTEAVVADPREKRRAAVYNPALDTWYATARPPSRIRAGSETHWSGSELLFVEPFGAAKRGLPAYDPLADRWRSTARSPINEISGSALVDGVLVVVSGLGRTAVLDLESDTWTELPPLALPQASADAPAGPRVSLVSTGEQVYAFTRSDEVGFVPLDLEAGQWNEPSMAPFGEPLADPLWIDGAFVFLTPPAEPTPVAADAPSAPVEPPPSASEPEPTAAPLPASGRYDPASDRWEVSDNACGLDSSAAVWSGSLILDVGRSGALDPASGECFALPVSPWVHRQDAIRLWTGHEILELSGRRADGQLRRDGLAYDPFPGEDALGVALDKPSRPVRVRVPSMGIDLAVISDERRVAGSSPGYPACDVALEWSFFDRPGKPGTAWLLAHAQEGMFLPLLTTLRRDGKEGLLGRRVEVQLRDGRVFTYLTYRVNPRATTVDIGFKGRRNGEHRLVLQTSTGVGSAPKLLVAARLIDVGTTDEPRPRPTPRACG